MAFKRGRDSKQVLNGAGGEIKEADPLSLLQVVTWKEEGEWYLCRKLKERFRRVDVLQPYFITKPRSRFLAIIFDRLSLAVLTLRAFARRGSYDVVVSWSMPVGVCYGLLNRLFRGHKSPCHILRDFHINMLRTDWSYRLRLGLLRCALPGIDVVLCTSREEERIYAEKFAIVPERLCFFPDAPPSQFFQEQVARPVSDYLFACGNSDRDFATLVEAVKRGGYQTIILSQQFQPQQPLPTHVRLMSRRVSVPELQDLIQRARVVVVPLEHYQVAAGQNSMLEAMAIGRPVIVSENYATREYAQNGLTALFYPPGDIERLCQLVQQVFEDRNAAEAMAARGRESVMHLLDEQVLILVDIVRRYASGSDRA